MNGLPSPTSDIPITNKHVDKCRDLMKKSLSRIQKQSVEMEQVGNEVLHELRRQDFQMVSNYYCIFLNIK